MDSAAVLNLVLLQLLPAIGSGLAKDYKMLISLDSDNHVAVL